MKAFKVFENITEIISWLQIVASPTLLCGGIGAFIYFRNPNLINLIIAFCVSIVGLVSGILYANKAWKTKGTVWFMSRVIASPELDYQDTKTNINKEETKLYEQGFAQGFALCKIQVVRSPEGLRAGAKPCSLYGKPEGISVQQID